MCLAQDPTERALHPTELGEAVQVDRGGSRRCQQRAQREIRIKRGTRNLASALESLAGGPDVARAVGRGSSSALSANDLTELEGQVRDLDRRLRQRAAGTSPPMGWEALARLSRETPGYGVNSASVPRGELVRANVDAIDLPASAGAFGVQSAVPDVGEWKEWMVRSSEDRAPLDNIQAYADPGLRGRKLGAGDGLEVLAARMVRSGLLKPTKRARGVKGVKLMTVAKTGGRQRLVWDMRQSNAAFLPPPRAKLGSVGALAALELGEPGFMAAAATDVPNFFYALRMPEGFESYVVLEGVDVQYVRSLLGPLAAEWPADVDALGCTCLPMGFSWAPYLAQRVLEHVVAEAGLAGETELVHGSGQVALRKWATMCYLDDFTVLVQRATRAAARADAAGLLKQVKEHLAKVGLGSHKDQCGEVLEVLGVVLDASGDQVTLRPQPAKLALLLAATQEAVRRRSVSARTLQRLVGHWAWWLQLRRPLYSVFQEVYPFMVAAGAGGRVQLPAAVRRELQLMCSLAPLLHCNLSWPVTPVVHMVDAGPKQGAVVVCKVCPAPVTSEDVAPPQRRKWQLAVQRTWKHDAHNNLQEGRTVLWAVARCARAGLRERVCVVYTDSLVVLGAFTKGRSSSRSLNHLCRRYASLCLTFRLRVVLKYVPSAANWADGPSRGYRYPCVAPETAAKAVLARPLRPPPGLGWAAGPAAAR